MKASEVYYERNFPLAEKFCFEKIGVLVVVEEGDKSEDVLGFAKKWVDRRHWELHPEIYQVKRVTKIPEQSENSGEVFEDGLPVIQANGKAKPTIVELKKYELAIKNKDKKAIEELEKNYLFTPIEKV